MTVPLSPILGQLLFWAMIAFATIIFVGIALHSYHYRRLGYPPAPSCWKTINSRDSIETIVEKIEPALRDGFRVSENQ